MNWKVTAAIVVVVIGALAGGFYIYSKKHSRPPVKVSFRLTVTPPQQVGYALEKANSARFKYMLGKISGTDPFLAQQLTLRPVPNSSLIEVEIGVRNKDEARRYAEAFVEVLQSLCGRQAQVALDRQTIR
jgi:hypothetical protein